MTDGVMIMADSYKIDNETKEYIVATTDVGSTAIDAMAEAGSTTIGASAEAGSTTIGASVDAGSTAIGVAVDVGSTTIGVSCVDMVNREEIISFNFPNPQVLYGADIITRIKHCIDEPEMTNRLSDMLICDLDSELYRRLGESYDDISLICYSGNTTMLHIMRGLSVVGLSKAPFKPVTLDYYEETESIHPTRTPEKENSENIGKSVTKIYLPGISAFVGADILSGAVGLDIGNDESYDLLIDLGTNGELLLLNKDYGYATSTACGTVFDHGVKGAVYGSESIHAIAACVKRKLIDETGLIKEPFFEKGIEIDKDFTVKQDNVRRFQMAKAAIYAGIICLIKKANIGYDNIQNMYISGGLGFYLDVRDAFITGMLPVEFKEKISVVGNTSLMGAKKYILEAKALYDKADSTFLEKCENIRTRTTSFELADYEHFQDIYIGSMNFC